MGTIVPRKRKGGSIGYTAQILLKKSGEIIHREAKTFDRRAAAAAWISKRETEIRENGPERPRSTVTVADAIDRFMSDSRRELGRTNKQVLNSIKKHDFANLLCEKVKSQEIVAFARELSADKKPQTVGNYISHLGAVFAVAQPAWDYPLGADAMQSARAVLSRLGLIGRSDVRDRRPYPG